MIGPVPKSLGLFVGIGLCWLVSMGCNRVDVAPRNVLLVSIDTLRADHVGAYGAADAGTPTLDRLAREGVRFDAAFSPAPITLPSHSTLLTGLEPHRHGVRHNGIHRLDDRVTTLAERLSAAGYATGASVGAMVLRAESGIAQGFEFFDDAIEAGGDHAEGSRRAEDVNRPAMAWLEATPEPFFLFVHYYDPHRPYAPPAPYAAEASSAYAGEIRYADAQLGALLAHLERLGRIENTLVVVTADHGEGLGEHDELTHAYAIYDATQHVPLVMRGPGLPQGVVVEEIARTADLMPTLMDWLGLPELRDIDGESLAPLWRGEPSPPRTAYLESLATRYDHGWSPLFGLRTRDHLYIRSPEAELYAQAEDPAQTKNRLRNPREEDESLAKAFESELDRRLSDQHTAAHEALDAASLAQLQALGYAIESAPAESNGLDPKIGRKSLALYHEGNDLYLRGQAEEAAARFEAMLEISPASGEGWVSLGAARLDLGELEAAEAATREAIERMPEKSGVWLQQGVIAMAMGDPAEAKRAFRAALDRDPGSPGAQLRLLRLMIIEGDLAAALEFDHALADRAPTDEVLLRRVADLWEATGQPEVALAAYHRVLEIAPESPRDHMHLAIALIRLGRRVEAQEHIERAGEVVLQPKAQRALQAAYLEAGQDPTTQALMPKAAIRP